LQRLKARALLQLVRHHPTFPVVVETYRECLEQDLDLPQLRTFLQDVGSGRIQVVRARAETPKPVAAGVLVGLTAAIK
jgi:ATP-dependent Lhr-like helicase